MLDTRGSVKRKQFDRPLVTGSEFPWPITRIRSGASFTLLGGLRRTLLPLVHRRLIHRLQQVLTVAVVVGIERPHEGTAEPKAPIGVRNPEVG
jgi:hypothetical protein